MIKATLTALLLVSPLAAFAGAQSFSCQSLGNQISFSVGNEGDGMIRIKFQELSTGNFNQLSLPVTVMPNYGYAGSNEENSVTVIPVANAKILSSETSHQRVTHKDGSSCDGREFWDTKTLQKFVLTARDGDALSAKLDFYDKKVQGQTQDGYLVLEMQCRDWGVTSSGGCIAEEGDTVEIIKDRK